MARHSCFGAGLAVPIFNLFEDLRQLFRQHHVADFNRRKKCGGEGAQIDDPSALVQALQGRNRLSEIAELAVVVVLQNVAVVVHRPLDQFIAAGNRHYHARRELVGRIHVYQALHIGGQLLHHDSFFIDWNPGNVQSLISENFPNGTVSRHLRCGVGHV